MKLVRLCLLVLLCASLAALPVCAAGQGDTNGDGTVSIQDVNLLLNVIASGEAVPDEEAYDVNGDGILSIKDVTGALQLISGVAVPRAPRLWVTVTDTGLQIEVKRLPEGVAAAGVLVLGKDADAGDWKTDPEAVKAMGQMQLSLSVGSCFLPLEEPSAPCTVVVTYAGGQLVKEVN